MKFMSLLLLLAISSCTPCVSSKVESIDFLVVQSGASFEIEGDRLILKGTMNSLFFSDHPNRIVKEVGAREFVDVWRTSKMEVDPPNAVISVFGEERPYNVVLVLNNLELGDNDEVIYTYQLIKGQLPSKSASFSLFIDAFPTSVNDQITDSVSMVK